MSCMSDIISLAFSFHTPTFFAKVRISWNSWPLFSCWLRSCDVRFRLGSRVCVCVFVCLFCSVVVVLFVVGRQQHCRYIVIDAMVYPKNWIWKTSLVLERPQESLDWIWYSYIWFRDREDFEFRSYDIVHESTEMSFGWCFIIYFVFWKTCSSLTIFWSWMWSGTMSIFLRIWSDDPYMVVMWFDEMSCRKGVWKFDALREHPLGKGEATCHSSSWHSFMHGRLVENILLVARETCALWSIWITIFY